MDLWLASEIEIADMVALQDEDGQPIRYAFVDGAAKKMIPQWIEEK